MGYQAATAINIEALDVDPDSFNRAAVLEYLRRARIPFTSAYTPQTPTPKQLSLISNMDLDVLYGGAAGGGKSSGMLMAALQYFNVKGYAALILRKRYKDLSLPGALMPRADSWLTGKAHWNSETHTWTSKEGGTLTFGYIDGPRDHEQYQSAEFQFIGIDEATQIRWQQIRYMFSRLRRLKEVEIPIRFRLSSNPGGKSHTEIKEHYVRPEGRHGRTYIKAILDDNPYLDADQYELSLAELTAVDRARLRWGDWDIVEGGRVLDRSWFDIVDDVPRKVVKRLRYWDLAATEPYEKNPDPDFTAGALLSVTEDGSVYIEDATEFKLNPGKVERRIIMTATLDGGDTEVWMEQEPAASGKTVIHMYRKLLMGFTFRGDKVTGKEPTRINPLASYAEGGNVYLVRGSWNQRFLDQAETYPDGQHDDMLKAVAQGFLKLPKIARKVVRVVRF